MDLLTKFGLTLRTGNGLTTASGAVHGDTGQVDICWQGRLHCAECVGRSAGGPALIGTKLLRGNRLVVSSPYGETTAKVTAMSESYLDGVLRRVFGWSGHLKGGKSKLDDLPDQSPDRVRHFRKIAR